MEKKYLDEWERSLDFLKAVKNNLELNDFKTAANREYFAIERAIITCLLIEGKRISKNHKKIWEASRLLDLGIDMYSLMRELYDLRLQADYGKRSEIIELNKENLLLYLKKIEDLINKIKKKYKIDE